MSEISRDNLLGMEWKEWIDKTGCELWKFRAVKPHFRNPLQKDTIKIQYSTGSKIWKSQGLVTKTLLRPLLLLSLQWIWGYSPSLDKAVWGWVNTYRTVVGWTSICIIYQLSWCEKHDTGARPKPIWPISAVKPSFSWGEITSFWWKFNQNSPAWDIAPHPKFPGPGPERGPCLVSLPCVPCPGSSLLWLLLPLHLIIAVPLPLLHWHCHDHEPEMSSVEPLWNLSKVNIGARSWTWTIFGGCLGICVFRICSIRLWCLCARRRSKARLLPRRAVKR